MKICKGCHAPKPVNEFTRDRQGKDGLKSRCRTCLTADKKRSRHKNPFPNRAACKRYREANPEKINAMMQRYRVANREKVRKNHHNWTQKNKDKCAVYQRRSQLKMKYGLSLAEFSKLSEKQGGKCAICGDVSEKNLVVDHDHPSGNVRELLCVPCNLGIGNLKDDPKVVLAAFEYLKRHAYLSA